MNPTTGVQVPHLVGAAHAALQATIAMYEAALADMAQRHAMELSLLRTQLDATKQELVVARTPRHVKPINEDK